MDLLAKQHALFTLFLAFLLAGCTGVPVPSATPGVPPAAASPSATLLSATSTAPPVVTTVPSETPAHTPLPTQVEGTSPSETSPGPLTITIVYNNIAADPRLATDWGFAAFIEFNDRVVLFDTGTNGQVLLQIMQTLGLDPASIQAVVISHEHQDHIGGLPALLAVSSQPPVYVLPSFGAAYLRQLRQMTEVVETSPGQPLTEEILTTGEIPGRPPEQALLIRTSQGIVVVTGCAHSGIVTIIEKAIELTGGPVRLVLGGFHLRELTQSQVQAILADFRRLGVQEVAPSHCTGDLAIRLFAAEYGEDFIQTGAGSVIVIDGGQ